ncbi:MAG TPA: class IV adenylate cyclase [Chitinophagaceae bacterium]|jgi:predicted adenylyl cyclase CyaB
MSSINIEIKARTTRTAEIRRLLLEEGADFRGTDRQTDTYFNVPHGRLKLRQGNIENSLIYYERENASGPKTSHFDLAPVTDGEALKAVLTKSLGVKVVVEKEREIYFIENVKFHLDTLRQLGNFVEIEASNRHHPLSLEHLHEQCNYYMRRFTISGPDLVNLSYSDMLMSL